MPRFSTLLLSMLLLPSFAGSQDTPQVRQATHEVVRGETLWDLAERYLGNPFRWPIIYEANTGQVRDPDLIFPGQLLVIPGLGGEMARVGQVTVTTQGVPVAALQPAPGIAPAPGRPPRTVFYQGPISQAGTEGAGPDAPSRYDLSGERANLRAVPIGLIYGTEWLTEQDVEVGVGGLGRFTRVVAERAPRGPARIAERMLILTEPGIQLQRGDILQSFRMVRETEAGEYVQRPTGILVVMEVGEEGVEAAVSSEFDRISEGDRVRLAPEDLPPRGVAPVRVSSNVTGTILEFAEDRPICGLGARVFLDLGLDHGVAIGDVFAASTGEEASMPGEEAALLQVTLVEDSRATARVIGLRNPTLSLGDRLWLVEKMPG